MQLRRRRNKLQSIILIFPDTTTTSNVFLPLQLEAECIAEYVELRYPTALNIVFLPDTFVSVMSLLCKKQLQFCEIHFLVLSHLAQICNKS